MVPAYDKTGFYTVNSNIDVERLNAIHSARGVPYPFGFSNLLLGIGNTNMDCFLSANLKSELDIDPRYASAYKTRMNTSINRILNRTSEITSFSQDVAYGFMSIGQAFEKGTITVQELLEILNK